MPQTNSITIDGSVALPEFWPRLAGAVLGWLAAQGVAARDAVVVLPFAQLIAQATAAFAARGGWLPRIETSRTLAASLAPPAPAEPGMLSGDADLDALTLAQLLRAQPGLSAWEQRDRRGFGDAVARTVATAWALRGGAGAQPPAQRAAWWQAIAAALPAGGGPGGVEVQLARVAMEWARLADATPTDALHAHRPGAWIWLHAGGRDALGDAVLAHAGVPALAIDADPPADDPFAASAAFEAPSVVQADGAEHEAQAAATEVIDALNAGAAAVALIALDRATARRVRALLERAQVGVADETGWALSTTRAAARLMALLRGAEANADAELEWLKAWPAADAGLVIRLERHWRAGRMREIDRDRALVALRRRACALAEPLATREDHPLAQWLRMLHSALRAAGLEAPLQADAAGAQLLAALRMAEGPATAAAWAQALQAERIGRDAFVDWLGRRLEGVTFVPPPAPAARVVVTPLARAILRPFDAVILAGADENRLGARPAPTSLLPESLAAEHGLPTPRRLQQEQAQAVAQLLRLPRVTFVHRRSEGDEPVAASPLVERIALARGRGGQPGPRVRVATLPSRAVSPVPVARPAPAAPADLPTRLSASRIEALRDCPYRFFARAVLDLREVDELETPADKREYGNWLHAVLHRFHATRDRAADDVAALHAAADAVSAEAAIAPARLLPYRAGFEDLVPRYVAWLHARDAQGSTWSEGELEAERVLPELGGVVLEGRIDRLDTRADGGRELVDYKTGSVEGLKAKLRNRFEDTQLPAYALLVGADAADAAPTTAMYLALDDRKAPLELPHRQVVASAHALRQGLAQDLDRLRAGAAMAALGEGRTCESCEARGLCRRDHWSVAGAQPEAVAAPGPAS